MNITTELIFSLFALIGVIITIRAIIKMKKINDKFNKAIVLIPLYKKNFRIILSLAACFALLGVSIYALISFQERIFYGSLSLILLSAIIFLVFRLNFRCGILDIGIIVPYRFIDFTLKFEYLLEEDEIIFYKDKNGYDTIGSVTEKLRFDKNNLGKLKYLLKGHENK